MATFDDSPIKKKKPRKKPPRNKRCFIHIIDDNVETVSAFTNVSWKVYSLLAFYLQFCEKAYESRISELV